MTEFPVTIRVPNQGLELDYLAFKELSSVPMDTIYWLEEKEEIYAKMSSGFVDLYRNCICWYR